MFGGVILGWRVVEAIIKGRGGGTCVSRGFVSQFFKSSLRRRAKVAIQSSSLVKTFIGCTGGFGGGLNFLLGKTSRLILGILNFMPAGGQLRDASDASVISGQSGVIDWRLLCFLRSVSCF